MKPPRFPWTSSMRSGKCAVIGAPIGADPGTSPMMTNAPILLHAPRSRCRPFIPVINALQWSTWKKAHPKAAPRRCKTQPDPEPKPTLNRSRPKVAVPLLVPVRGRRNAIESRLVVSVSCLHTSTQRSTGIPAPFATQCAYYVLTGCTIARAARTSFHVLSVCALEHSHRTESALHRPDGFTSLHCNSCSTC